jgi:hypothetical protein
MQATLYAALRGSNCVVRVLMVLHNFISTTEPTRFMLR